MISRESLTPVLADLNQTSLAIEASAVVSPSGLVLCSLFSPGMDAEMAGTMGAALVSHGTRLAGWFDRGTYEDMLLKGEHGYMLAVKADKSLSLVLLATAEAEVDSLLLAAHQASQRINACMEAG